MAVERIVFLRGRAKEVELVTLDILLDEYHPLGWKGWYIKRDDFERGIRVEGIPSLLFLRKEWVEFGYMERERHDES